MNTTTYNNSLNIIDCKMTFANENDNMDGEDCTRTDVIENENEENENMDRDMDMDEKNCEMKDSNEGNNGIDWESSTVATRSIFERTVQESSFHDALHDSPMSRSRSKVYYRLDSSVRRYKSGKKHQLSFDTIMTPIPQKRTYHES